MLAGNHVPNVPNCPTEVEAFQSLYWQQQRRAGAWHTVRITELNSILSCGIMITTASQSAHRAVDTETATALHLAEDIPHSSRRGYSHH